MYRSTLAVYSINLTLHLGHRMRRGHGRHRRRRGHSRGCISKTLVSVKVVRYALIGEVIHQGKHHGVGGGDHLLRTAGRQA